MVLLLALVSLGHASPQRILARQGETLTERVWWDVEAVDTGPARPKWRNRRGTWTCWTFPDGVAARCQQQDKRSGELALDRRFDAGGRPETTAMYAKGELSTVVVHGLEPVEVDVSTRHIAVAGPVQVSSPEPIAPDPNGFVRWTMPQGELTVATSAEAIDVFDASFAEALRAGCSCVVEDRATTWLFGQQAVRWRIRHPDPEAPRIAELWTLPQGQSLVMIAFTTPATGTLPEIQERLAHGRAWVSLLAPAPDPPSEEAP